MLSGKVVLVTGASRGIGRGDDYTATWVQRLSAIDDIVSV